MSVTGFDHIALPTGKPKQLIEFYGALGFKVPDVSVLDDLPMPVFEIRFGTQKINVHLPALWQSKKFTLRGPTAVPGCSDLCFVWDGTEDELRRRLTVAQADILVGPVKMRGAQGPSASIYTRDPDGNLVEFMFYDLTNITSEISDRLPL
ncbi:MAG: VOC family protein [Pseudomonadales bacterium]|nr:VOC family protein [Pseudomonadales bacterium]